MEVTTRKQLSVLSDEADEEEESVIEVARAWSTNEDSRRRGLVTSRKRRRAGPRKKNSAVQFLWSRAAFVETVLEAAAATLDARDLARIACVNREAFKARWPWPCPFLRYGDGASSSACWGDTASGSSSSNNNNNQTRKQRTTNLEHVPLPAFARLACMLEAPRRRSRRLRSSDGVELDHWIGRSERSYRSALAISVVAHCSTANRRAVGATGAIARLVEHLAIDDEDPLSGTTTTTTRQQQLAPNAPSAGKRRAQYATYSESSNQDYVPRLRSAAARALCQLARESQCRAAICELGGVERLVAVVRTADDAVVEARGRDKAAQAIANLAARDDTAKGAIFAANAVPALVDLLDSHLRGGGGLSRFSNDDDDDGGEKTNDAPPPPKKKTHHPLGRGAENAAAALSNLAGGRFPSRVAAAQQVVDAGAVPLLANLLNRGAVRGRENAAGALANLAERAATDIVDAGALPPLVAMVDAPEDGERVTERAREKAAAALRYLTYNHARNRALVLKAGALEPLVRLAARPNAPAKGKQHALQALHQLVANDDDVLRAVLRIPEGAALFGPAAIEADEDDD